MSGLAEGRGDGRNVDPDIGILEGEASQQRVPKDRQRAEGAAPSEMWSRVPGRDGQTYYLVYDNPGVLRPGEQVTIAYAGVRLEHVPVL